MQFFMFRFLSVITNAICFNRHDTEHGWTFLMFLCLCLGVFQTEEY